MDFERILTEWESGKIIRSSKKSGNNKNRKKQNWLDSYPPPTNAAEVKDPPKPLRTPRSVRNRMKPQVTLDLHGMTEKEARQELTRFIRSMKRKGLQKGLIIHGKGLHSESGGVLKKMVKNFLEMSGDIGEFRHAARKDGGTGATWFLLRQNRLV